ncbi:hypothetical protein SAMN05445850_8201 [Paraburkholderia tuberum]|uniref:Uncharacterized protein n=1 Tax=Paraburkholderia tuberum TaxID=157910 RepID=A0A1H1KJV4_9BURK|nr:hypothetical protein SAMN05445850_8201 [Paraburkholderia tuberum]
MSYSCTLLTPPGLAFQAAKGGGNRAQRAEPSCMNEVVRTKLVDVATCSVHLQGNRAETGSLSALSASRRRIQAI